MTVTQHAISAQLTQRQWSIYALHDPRTYALRYIGWAYDPERRLRDHLKCAPKERSYKANWLRQIIALGSVPMLSILQTGMHGWAEAEKDWIAYFRRMGAPLTNLTDGGDGMPGYRWTEEQLQRLRNRVITSQHRENIAKARRGKPLSKAHRDTLSAKRKGQPLTEPQRQRLIASHAGKPLSEAHKNAIRTTLTGRTFSVETLRKMSAAQKNRQRRSLSPEHRAKLAAAKLGKPGTPWTAEHRSKVKATKDKQRRENIKKALP